MATGLTHGAGRAGRDATVGARRAGAWSGGTRAFGDAAKAMGEAWEDVGPGVEQADRAVVQEAAQKAVAEGEERVFGGLVVR